MVVVMYRGFWVATRRHIFGVNRRFRTTFCPFFRVNEHETNEYLGSGARSQGVEDRSNQSRRWLWVTGSRRERGRSVASSKVVGIVAQYTDRM
jgi:hypothetical protein